MMKHRHRLKSRRQYWWVYPVEINQGCATASKELTLETEHRNVLIHAPIGIDRESVSQSHYADKKFDVLMRKAIEPFGEKVHRVNFAWGAGTRYSTHTQKPTSENPSEYCEIVNRHVWGPYKTKRDALNFRFFFPRKRVRRNRFIRAMLLLIKGKDKPGWSPPLVDTPGGSDSRDGFPWWEKYPW